MNVLVQAIAVAASAGFVVSFGRDPLPRSDLKMWIVSEARGRAGRPMLEHTHVFGLPELSCSLEADGVVAAAIERAVADLMRSLASYDVAIDRARYQRPSI